MLSSPIDFYWFSGTGNTLLVVRRMEKVLAENGLKVNLFRIEKSSPMDVNASHALGLAFPVAMQSTYPFVWDFIRNLPESENTKVFMVDTLYMFSGGIVGPLREVLKNKGYDPAGASEIRMPHNFFHPKNDERKNSRMIEAGLAKAEKYAQELAEGKSGWGRIPVLSDIMYRIGTGDSTWKKAAEKGSKYQVSAEKCTSCGLCVTLCPVDNIRMKEIPVFLDKCCLCMRCHSFCPYEAITYPDKEYEPYTAVKALDLLSEKQQEKGKYSSD